MSIQIRPILRVLGALTLLVGVLMWSGMLMYAFDQIDDWQPLFFSGLISLTIGGILFSIKRNGTKQIGKREGYLIVALGWCIMIIFSMLPYLWAGATESWIDAFFETVSGLTTTGATIFNDIESVPKDILYWRSLTQWLGGMGIVVLTVAIFPLLGIGGVELFVAEAPGPTSDKLHPRIRETAKRIWLIYLFLTALLIIILYVEGMSWYDAINHGLTTMATGGFSTKNDSIISFSPLIQYTIAAFMLIAGTNYTLIYFSLKGNIRKIWSSDEFRFYLKLVGLLIVIISLYLWLQLDYTLEYSFRISSFQVLSILTTTGYATADYTSWHNGYTFLFFILLFFGASAGSTSGGIKLIRILVFLKNSFLEFKRLLHPQGMIRVRLNNQIVPGKVLTNIVIFILVYMLIFIFGTIILSFLGLDLPEAIGASATSISNVGPAIGKLGPMNNFAWLSDSIKLFLPFLMVLGRLELFTILILFTPYFWRSN